jgi:hypothetical protein
MFVNPNGRSSAKAWRSLVSTSLDNPEVFVGTVGKQRQLGIDPFFAVLCDEYSFCHSHGSLLVRHVILVLFFTALGGSERKKSQQKSKRYAHFQILFCDESGLVRAQSHLRHGVNS